MILNTALQLLKYIPYLNDPQHDIEYSTSVIKVEYRSYLMIHNMILNTALQLLK